MKLLIRLSLRNLLRQKRRNALLGAAMAIGVAILVVANSFANGISDIMFNKIMRYVTGHVAVRFNERGGVMREIFRDRDRAFAALRNEPLIEEADESIGMFARAIGNGKSDNIILIGVDTKKGASEKAMAEVQESFRLVDGSWKDIESGAFENPAIISEDKARYLNVKKHDVVRVRFRNMFGQDQAARFTVVGIMKIDNIFMQGVTFLEMTRAKELLGYRPWETGSLSLKIKDPAKNAAALADRLHEKFSRPGTAVIYAAAAGRSGRRPVTLLGFKSDDEAKKRIQGLLKLSSGSYEKLFRKGGVLLSAPLARELGVGAGDALKVSYARKFEKAPKEISCTVAAVCASGCPAGDTVMMEAAGFYDLYYGDLPAGPAPGGEPYAASGAWAALTTPEWVLLKRTYNTDDYSKKYQEISRNKWKGTTVDVSTMYETASDILKLESVLNIITISAVLVLFFIILLGVVNTLRMTIRERTREIGTVRAIGMQRRDVRNMFILETFFLTLFASGTGLLLGFGAMRLLSLITFTIKDNPLGMLLVNSHLYFLPTFAGIAGSVLLIIAIAVCTAFFPARRAANMSPAKALGHFT
jgi:ABC-type lipoprotein release transport system permease subunit